ncbi:retrograde regulation protein 2 [Hypomontagnella submonticulosa]|nr:retrograde regulation protein 2 [Hypomontagnella submonticulosa]
MATEEHKISSLKDLELQKDNASISMTTPADYLDKQIVKSLKRKADFILLPILTIAYLCNSLDRSNVSNAHTAGLEEDVGLIGNQFNQVLTFYQIPFIVLGPLMTVVTKLVGAKYAVAGMLFVFGIASLATGWARTFEHLVICRVFVGAFESGFLASVIYYLSTWYTRAELASRIGIFYGSLVASSAFGGLLAYGMFQVTPTEGYFRWSYLFFLEGGLTILWSLVCFFLVPSSPKTAWFLNAAEKEVAELRIKDDVQSLESQFTLREGLMEFRSPHGYIRVIMIFVSGTMLTSNANFLAMVVKRLGLSVVQTNLYTVAPALTGAVILVLWCKSSDYFHERGFHVAASILVSLVGYVILFTIDTSNTAVLYFAMFLCTIGVSYKCGSQMINNLADDSTGVSEHSHRLRMDCVEYSKLECPSSNKWHIYRSWKLCRFIIIEYIFILGSPSLHNELEGKCCNVCSWSLGKRIVFVLDEMGEPSER